MPRTAAGIAITDISNIVTETISSTMVINSVTFARDSRSYSCEFTNNAGARISANGLVKVQGERR